MASERIYVPRVKQVFKQARDCREEAAKGSPGYDRARANEGWLERGLVVITTLRETTS